MIVVSKIFQAGCLFKVHMHPFGFCIFAMSSTFQDEMQYIFVEKNFIFMDFLAVKVAATDVI